MLLLKPNWLNQVKYTAFQCIYKVFIFEKRMRTLKKIQEMLVFSLCLGYHHLSFSLLSKSLINCKRMCLQFAPPVCTLGYAKICSTAPLHLLWVVFGRNGNFGIQWSFVESGYRYDVGYKAHLQSLFDAGGERQCVISLKRRMSGPQYMLSNVRCLGLKS